MIFTSRVCVCPDGARFSQAVVAANCAGGTQATNADRQGLLVRVDRLTGKTWYLERSVQDLLKSSTSEADNPFLMPDDAIVCYDSTVTNTRLPRSRSSTWARETCLPCTR